MFFYSEVLLSLLFLLSLSVKNSLQISLEEELTLTFKEKLILDKFKVKVISRLPHEYMKQDIYLVRWLRGSHFDQEIAESKLFENLKWREMNKMDSIIEENWSDFEVDYPYFLEGCDKEGRPVARLSVEDWDARKAVISGQGDKLIRYGYKLLEEISTLIREGQKLGRNVTQFSVIVDMNNFGLSTHACPACLPVYINMLFGYESHYPGSVHHIMAVNNVRLFDNLLNILRPLASESLRETFKSFGKNKMEWKSWLLREMSEDQLTKQFGGIKESAITPDELRTNKIYPC